MHVSKKLQVVVNETSEEEKVDEKSLVTSAPTYLCYNEIQEMTMKPAKTKNTHKGERTKVLLPSVSKLSKWHFKKGCCAWLMVPPRGWFHSRGCRRGVCSGISKHLVVEV